MKKLLLGLLLFGFIGFTTIGCNNETADADATAQSDENVDANADADADADNADEGYKVDYLFASADEEVKVSYRPREKKDDSHMVLTRGEEEIKLMQTEAWAKGAIYSDGNITWEARGADCKLIEGDKTTEFKEKEELK